MVFGLQIPPSSHVRNMETFDFTIGPYDHNKMSPDQNTYHAFKSSLYKEKDIIRGCGIKKLLDELVVEDPLAWKATFKVAGLTHITTIVDEYINHEDRSLPNLKEIFRSGEFEYTPTCDYGIFGTFLKKKRKSLWLPYIWFTLLDSHRNSEKTLSSSHVSQGY